MKTASSELEKGQSVRSNSRFLSDPAMGARRHSDHKEGVTFCDVTTLGSDDEICNLLLRSCQSSNLGPIPQLICETEPSEI